MQSALLPMDNSNAEEADQTENTENQTEDSDENTINPNAPEFKAEDVDGMSENEVLNYTYFDIPQNIDDATRQKLYARADQIRQNRENGTSLGQSAQELAKGIIRDAQNFLSSKKL